MASQVSVKLLYKEVQALRKDVNAMKLSMIPVEHISDKERRELRQILREMESGKEKRLDDIFKFK